MSDAPDIADDKFMRRLAWQSVAIMVVMFALTALLGYWLRDPITDLATQFVQLLGAPGIFLGVLAADAISFPIPASTYLFAGVASGASVIPVLIATSLASLMGGALAYLVGPQVARIPFLARRLEIFRPRGEALFKRWGAWAVGIAAVTPMPFSIICWLAGIYRMPFKPFFTATLVRVPRVCLYYGLFALGWASAAG
ncbi:YqaA family protein [Lujinxingia litoralis]|uniref:YqaA family protein n=1 Tax=Lujinxingia litoralis TaxID=2211119 RepID=UPI001314094D|nr:VTT domain-containing protein [Lujinxingia litoralis]